MFDSSQTPGAVTPQSILVIDNQPQGLSALTEALRKDYHTHVVSSISPTFESALVDPQLALIILTIRQPEINEYQLCRQLKKDIQTRDIPLMIIASQAGPEHEALGLQAGANDYIREPFHLQSALARIENLLSLKRRTDLLQELVYVDELTGVANRRQFDKSLNDELRRSRRDSKPLAVGLIDVDYFKSFNDIYGHAKGDDCLKQIAKVLTSTVRRPGDLIARYGGEEFASILPATDFAGATVVANRFCKQITDSQIVHKAGTQGIVTVSVGICALQAEKDVSAEDLIKTADRALYQAKEKGKNRCECVRGT